MLGTFIRGSRTVATHVSIFAFLLFAPVSYVPQAVASAGEIYALHNKIVEVQQERVSATFDAGKIENEINRHLRDGFAHVGQSSLDMLHVIFRVRQRKLRSLIQALKKAGDASVNIAGALDSAQKAEALIPRFEAAQRRVEQLGRQIDRMQRRVADLEARMAAERDAEEDNRRQARETLSLPSRSTHGGRSGPSVWRAAVVQYPGGQQALDYPCDIQVDHGYGVVEIIQAFAGSGFALVSQDASENMPEGRAEFVFSEPSGRRHGVAAAIIRHDEDTMIVDARGMGTQWRTIYLRCPM